MSRDATWDTAMWSESNFTLFLFHQWEGLIQTFFFFSSFPHPVSLAKCYGRRDVSMMGTDIRNIPQIPL